MTPGCLARLNTHLDLVLGYWVIDHVIIYIYIYLYTHICTCLTINIRTVEFNIQVFECLQYMQQWHDKHEITTLSHSKPSRSDQGFVHSNLEFEALGSWKCFVAQALVSHWYLPSCTDANAGKPLVLETPGAPTAATWCRWILLQLCHWHSGWWCVLHLAPWQSCKQNVGETNTEKGHQFSRSWTPKKSKWGYRKRHHVQTCQSQAEKFLEKCVKHSPNNKKKARKKLEPQRCEL